MKVLVWQAICAAFVFIFILFFSDKIENGWFIILVPSMYLFISGFVGLIQDCRTPFREEEGSGGASKIHRG